MQGIYDTWRDASETVGPVPGAIVSLAFQPLPKRIHQKAKELGGVVMELDYSHQFSINHLFNDEKTVETYTATGNKIAEFENTGLLPETHRPLFMNDSYFR